MQNTKQLSILLILLGMIHASYSNFCSAETTRLAPRQQYIQELIQRLDADHYATRVRAESELRSLGSEAIDQLLEAQYSESPEVSLTAQQVVANLAINWTRPDEHPVIPKILENYSSLPIEKRQARAEWLAKLEDGAGFRAVGRIIRYDESDLIAKRAAISLMESFDETEPNQVEALQRTIESLGETKRSAANWLRAFQAELDPSSKTAGDQLDLWKELADEEQKLEDSVRTTKAISSAIFQKLAALAFEENSLEIAQSAVAHLIELGKGDASKIIAIGRWLVESNQVSIFEEEIWDAFEEYREDQPQFLYLAAEAFRETDLKRSSSLADQAFQLTEGKMTSSTDPIAIALLQLNTAIALERRGLTEWAIREYRRLLKLESDHWRMGFVREQAAIILSELLHDRGRDGEAADSLAILVEEESISLFGDDEEGGAESVESRMHYFRSEQYRQESNREKQMEFLQKAVAADPTDADVLIAMYRLPRADEKWKRTTKRHIQNAVNAYENNIKRLRSGGEITNRANIAKYLNQTAWLVGNTEGDQKKAIEQSRRSLELRPHSPGSLDTLGRTYFAVGDLKNALKYQRRAVKLEPHSRQITRQLEQFESATSQADQTPVTEK